ncbi:hypothetical protein P167DRAFT_565206 [Morchella conica CCBAS932]|uniref:Uncharacterized protein n=1 Tax=Morchella conica CCBAS932 TaxID=1392247 RepID=A0A3N4KPL7_9PEZI|nr:hypothetical protein P167DRAFT_565206 [Morchella conica CCBAS932]
MHAAPPFSAKFSCTTAWSMASPTIISSRNSKWSYISVYTRLLLSVILLVVIALATFIFIVSTSQLREALIFATATLLIALILLFASLLRDAGSIIEVEDHAGIIIELPGDSASLETGDTSDYGARLWGLHLVRSGGESVIDPMAGQLPYVPHIGSMLSGLSLASVGLKQKA